MYEYEFTVFVPTYNRGHTLGRLLEGLEQQTVRTFECVIVDDGSTDATEAVLLSWTKRASFPLIVVKQANMGKHVARNRALEIARGEFFVTVDSDDVLMPNALERMAYWVKWAVQVLGHRSIAGVEGLCQEMGTGEVIGDLFPAHPLVSDYIQTRFVMGVRGDKTRCIRTEVFRQYRFPVIPGENFITEAIVWNRMALEGQQFVYVNEAFALVEYQRGGLSARSRSVRAQNPRGASLYYDEVVRKVIVAYPVQGILVLRNIANWIRYTWHVGGFRAVVASVSRLAPRWLLYWITALPVAAALYMGDLRHRGRR